MLWILVTISYLIIGLLAAAYAWDNKDDFLGGVTEGLFWPILAIKRLWDKLRGKDV